MAVAKQGLQQPFFLQKLPAAAPRGQSYGQIGGRPLSHGRKSTPSLSPWFTRNLAARCIHRSRTDHFERSVTGGAAHCARAFCFSQNQILQNHFFQLQFSSAEKNWKASISLILWDICEKNGFSIKIIAISPLTKSFFVAYYMDVIFSVIKFSFIKEG